MPTKLGGGDLTLRICYRSLAAKLFTFNGSASIRDGIYRQSRTARPRVSLTSVLSTEPNDVVVTSSTLKRSIA